MALCMKNNLLHEALDEGTSMEDLQSLYNAIGNPSEQINKLKEDMAMKTSEAVDFLMGIEYYLSHPNAY